MGEFFKNQINENKNINDTTTGFFVVVCVVLAWSPQVLFKCGNYFFSEVAAMWITTSGAFGCTMMELCTTTDTHSSSRVVLQILLRKLHPKTKKNILPKTSSPPGVAMMHCVNLGLRYGSATIVVPINIAFSLVFQGLLGLMYWQEYEHFEEAWWVVLFVIGVLLSVSSAVYPTLARKLEAQQLAKKGGGDGNFLGPRSPALVANPDGLQIGCAGNGKYDGEVRREDHCGLWVEVWPEFGPGTFREVGVFVCQPECQCECSTVHDEAPRHCLRFLHWSAEAGLSEVDRFTSVA